MSKYKIIYGKERVRLLNEIGIGSLDDAHKVYAAYDGDLTANPPQAASLFSNVAIVFHHGCL